MVNIYTYRGEEGERAPKDVTEVIFAEGITEIRSSAFDFCKSLVTVGPFPSTLTKIRAGAFWHCESMQRE